MEQEGSPTEGGCSTMALEFIRLVNEYRSEHGEHSIAPSASLCFVSEEKVKVRNT